MSSPLLNPPRKSPYPPVERGTVKPKVGVWKVGPNGKLVWVYKLKGAK